MRRSYKIALASVSCAVAVIAVVAQAYVSTMSVAINVAAALAISLPLTQKSVSGAIFSYVAAGIIGFLAVNVKALPFIMFYAPYAIIQYALDFVFYKSEKIKLPKWAKIVIITVFKTGFFAAAFYGCLMLMKVVIADITLFGLNWTLPLLMAAGFVAFCVYDPLYRFVFVNVGRLVSKYAGKRGGISSNAAKGDNGDDKNFRESGTSIIMPLSNDEDIFEGFSQHTKTNFDCEREKEDGKTFSDDLKESLNGVTTENGCKLTETGYEMTEKGCKNSENCTKNVGNANTDSLERADAEDTSENDCENSENRAEVLSNINSGSPERADAEDSAEKGCKTTENGCEMTESGCETTENGCKMTESGCETTESSGEYAEKKRKNSYSSKTRKKERAKRKKDA